MLFGVCEAGVVFCCGLSTVVAYRFNLQTSVAS
jgi:hypothetical protein